jgi:hypothetical protein
MKTSIKLFSLSSFLFLYSPASVIGDDKEWRQLTYTEFFNTSILNKDNTRRFPFDMCKVST